MSEQGLQPNAGGGEQIVPARPLSIDVRGYREESPDRVCFFSNCGLFALGRFLRRGGFLLVTKSQWGWWPHLMWSPDMRTLYQFEPTEKKRRRLFPPFVYRGYVKETRL